MGALFVARHGRVAPLVAFGAAVLVPRAGGFALNYYFAADEPPPTSDSAPQSEGSRADLDAMSDGPKHNGNGNGLRYPSTTPSAAGSVEELYEKSIGGSLSPASESMDES